MLRFRTPTVVLLGGMLAALLVLLAYRFQNSSRIDQGLQPLEFTDPALANALRLPKDAVVLAVSKTTLVTAPFLLHENPEGAGGWVLALPRGAGTKQKTGRTTLSFSTPVEGLYRAWTRVRWKDVCGNSVILKVGEAPEQVAVDQIYEAWHWVQAGEFNLSAGKQTATLLEREDGIELDQLLFTQDAGFQPAGPLPRAPRDASVPTLAEQTSNPDSKVPEAAASRLLKAQPLQEAAPAGHAGPIRELRRFADDFSRSPGHGLGGWDSTSGRWQIAFDFDPNRIPNQYALTADAAQGHAVTLLKGKPWNGCRLSFSLLPLEKGRYGALLDRADGREDLRVAFETVAGPSRLQVTGAGEPRRVDLDAAFRLRQWQRVVIERWGWVVRVSVDDRPVLALLDAAPSMGQVGLFVAAGSAVFDDVAVEEIPWQADDGRLLKLPWRLGAGAQWFRPTEPGAAAALLGREGAISSEMDGWPVEEILLEEAPGNAGACTVEAGGLAAQGGEKNLRIFRRADSSGLPATRATFQAGKAEALIRRVAIRYGSKPPDCYTIGPYHFTSGEMEDPSDYLDFTPEEYQQMARSPEADKLLRRAKMKPLLGSRGESNSPWLLEQGSWQLRGAALAGTGPDASLCHAQEIAGGMELRMRLRLLDPASTAEVELYGGPAPGLRVLLSAAPTSTPASTGILALALPADAQWHEVSVLFTGAEASGCVDRGARKNLAWIRGAGDQVRLKVPAGRVEFDDLEFKLRRNGDGGFLYAFDRRETDWWREGGAWVDHGGIACILSSSWISLVAPQGEGLLWNKRTFSPNLNVAFNVEENSEWFGWHAGHSHEHHPFDNIRVQLAPEGQPERGYRLEVNALNRTSTVLYRQGKEVARVAQDGAFPIRYQGGHAPYSPRRNRIGLVKRGALLQALVNGKEVLRYTDPEPLDVQRVGIGGYKTHINFSHVEVRTLEE